MATKSELEAQLKAQAAKANTFNLFDAFADIRDSICIVTRTVKSQCLKAETITDILSNGVVNTAEYFDTYTRNQLSEVKDQSKL